MYRVWEDVEAIVEEEDKKEYDEREDGKLNGSTDLLRYQYRHMLSDHLTYNSSCHLWLKLEGEVDLSPLFCSSTVMGDLHTLSHQSTQLGASIGDLRACQTHHEVWDC